MGRAGHMISTFQFQVQVPNSKPAEFYSTTTSNWRNTRVVSSMASLSVSMETNGPTEVLVSSKAT